MSGSVRTGTRHTLLLAFLPQLLPRTDLASGSGHWKIGNRVALWESVVPLKPHCVTTEATLSSVHTWSRVKRDGYTGRGDFVSAGGRFWHTDRRIQGRLAFGSLWKGKIFRTEEAQAVQVCVVLGPQRVGGWAPGRGQGVAVGVGAPSCLLPLLTQPMRGGLPTVMPRGGPNEALSVWVCSSVAQGRPTSRLGSLSKAKCGNLQCPPNSIGSRDPGVELANG